MAPTRLTQRFQDAMVEAFGLHGADSRKGSHVPYMNHLLGTAAIVLHFGGDEDQAIAALLHDAVEDKGGRPRLELIGRQFGERVKAIVEGCTDTMETPKPEWRPRKEAYIRRIASEPADVLLVSAADKLDNARALVADLRVQGPGYLKNFKGGMETIWNYEALVDAYRQRDVGPIVTELALAVAEMRRLAEMKEPSEPAAR